MKNCKPLFYSVAIVFSLFISVLFEIGLEKLSLRLLEGEMLFLIFTFLYLSCRENGILSLYSLFLVFSMFFMYSRIIFEFIGYLNRQVNDFYFFSTRIHFTDRTIFTFLFYSVFYFIAIDFGTESTKTKPYRIINTEDNQNVKVFIFACIVLIFPLLLYKSYLDIKNVSINGYESNLDRSSYPIFLKGCGTIFISLIYCLFMFKLSKKEILIVVAIYLLYSLSASLRGSRSVFFIPLVFSLFLLWWCKVIKVSLLHISFVGIISVFLIAVFTNFLRGETISNWNIGAIFQYVLYGQGNSIGLPLYYIQFKRNIDSELSLPLLFSDWLSFFSNYFKRGSFYIGLIANKKHVSGGLGESLFLELMNLPFVYALFASFCIGKSLKYVDFNLFKNKFLTPLFMLMAQWLFVLTRFALFNFLDVYGISTLLLTYFMYLFFKSLSKYFWRKNYAA